MKIEQAKFIHGKAMKVLMFTQGIGEITNTDVNDLKAISLVDMLLANKLMEHYEEPTVGNTKTFHVTTTDAAIAELFIRLHDEDFMTALEFEDMCQVMNEVFDNTVNGHGVLIDSYGNYSLIELTHSGDCAEKTLITADSPREVYKYVKQVVSQAQENE